MKQIAVCDDIKNERQHIIEALTHLFQSRKEDFAIQEYDRGETFLADVEEEYVAFDMIFLDICMKGMNGLEIARRLRERGVNCPVIFLTNSPDYAIDSYEVEAVGYLLKPLQEEKLASFLDRLFKPNVRRRIAVKAQRHMRYFYIDEIMWIDSDKHTVTLHFSDNTSVSANDKLNTLEKQIDDKRFLRCHQSYPVNMAHVLYKTPRKRWQAITAWIAVYLVWGLGVWPITWLLPSVSYERASMLIGLTGIFVYMYPFPQIPIAQRIFTCFFVDTTMNLVVLFARTTSVFLAPQLPPSGSVVCAVLFPDPYRICRAVLPEAEKDHCGRASDISKTSDHPRHICSYRIYHPASFCRSLGRLE